MGISALCRTREIGQGIKKRLNRSDRPSASFLRMKKCLKKSACEQAYRHSGGHTAETFKKYHSKRHKGNHTIKLRHLTQSKRPLRKAHALPSPTYQKGKPLTRHSRGSVLISTARRRIMFSPICPIAKAVISASVLPAFHRNLPILSGVKDHCKQK